MSNFEFYQLDEEERLTLVKEICGHGLDQQAVDEAVTDAHLAYAGSVNNQGMEEQIYYLLSEGWMPEAIKAELSK